MRRLLLLALVFGVGCDVPTETAAIKSDGYKAATSVRSVVQSYEANAATIDDVEAVVGTAATKLDPQTGSTLLAVFQAAKAKAGTIHQVGVVADVVATALAPAPTVSGP